MAVYTNLAVDCGDDACVAEELRRVFSKLELQSSTLGSVSCDVEHIKPNRHWCQPDKFSDDAGDWHTLCVSPRGLGNSPSPSLIDELRPQLYEPLKNGLKFRSAWFGWEGQDAVGESDWLAIIEQMNRTGELPNMPGLILNENIVLNSDLKSKLNPFSDGFLWDNPATQSA